MHRIREIEHDDGLCAAVIPRDAPTLTIVREAAPSPCRWPSLAIGDVRMADLDAALAADPLFHLCPDGHEGQVDVRYWYFHPLNLSCRHCSEGGGICVVDPATVVCRHRMTGRSGPPIPEQ
jgi:hypothetical protein